MNDDARFGLWLDRIVSRLSRSSEWICQVLLREERYARLNLDRLGVNLKIEMVNGSATRSDWELVRWITPPDPELFIQQLSDLGKSLIFPS